MLYFERMRSPVFSDRMRKRDSEQKEKDVTSGCEYSFLYRRALQV
jgi:hypothetical protein